LSYEEKPSFTWLLLVIALGVCSLIYLATSYDDCDGKGGVLVEGALGEYECVPKK